MKWQATKGTCLLCQGTFGKAGMTKHLAKCLETPADASEQKSPARSPSRLLHLVVEGKNVSDYWLHLEAPATATLQDLDDFLRNLWLECCGHLSAFHIGAATYSVPMDDAWGFDEFPENEDMNVALGDVLARGAKFAYEYDFGSSTYLEGHVVGDRRGPFDKKKPIRLLARNLPPVIACGTCGQPATQVLGDQAWEPRSWFCDQCAKKTDEDEGFLPVVNSPRVGVCAYTG